MLKNVALNSSPGSVVGRARSEDPPTANPRTNNRQPTSLAPPEDRNTLAAFRTLSTSTNFKGWNSRAASGSAPRPGESQVSGFTRRQSINRAPGQALQRRDSATWNEPGHKHEFHRMFPRNNGGDMARADNACQKMLSILCGERQHRTSRRASVSGTELSQETVALAVTQDARSGEKHVWIAANGPELHRHRANVAAPFTEALRQKGVNEAVELHFLQPGPSVSNAHAEMQLLQHLVSSGHLRSSASGVGDQGHHRLTDFGTSKPACIGCGPLVDKALDLLAQPSYRRRDFNDQPSPILFHTATTNSTFLVPVPTHANNGEAEVELGPALSQFDALLKEPLPARTADATTQTPQPPPNPGSAATPPASAPAAKPSYSRVATATPAAGSAPATRLNYSAAASRQAAAPAPARPTQPAATRPAPAAAPRPRPPIADQAVRMEPPVPQPARTSDQTTQTDSPEPART